MALSSSSGAADLNRQALLDTRGLDGLRQRAAQDPKAVTLEAAKQFEALFMQQLLKSMRESAQTTGMLDNEGSQMGTEMLDAEWAKRLAGRPGGLAEVIARQLDQQLGGALAQPVAPAAGGLAGPGASLGPSTVSLVRGRTSAPAGPPQQAAADFVQQHQAAAAAAEAATGIPAPFMLSQAALESGWGRKQILNADGTPSNNLFGIKAGSGWKGATADVMTTEYIDGEPRKMVQRFRAYASAADSFADYARLMKSSPRYSAVVAAGADATGFAQGLQRAGYATDPAYADKLSRVINTTLRLQRSQQG